MAKRRLKRILFSNITNFFKSIEAELSNSELRIVQREIEKKERDYY